MKIEIAQHQEYIYIETDEKELNSYRRHSADVWECLYGQAWEPVLFPEELEAAYQTYLKGF
jgi:hypothetical protein